jgi:myosin heavy subunit
MTYAAILQQLPAELQMPMLELVETLQQDMRAQYAVRREDFDELKAVVADLAAAQKRTEERVDRLEAAVLELAAAQKRTEQRVEELAAAQKRTEQRVEELAAAQKRTEDILQKLVIRVGKNTGKILEIDYRDKAFAYFGTLLRKVKVISLQKLEPTLEQHLSEAEFNALLPLDLLVSGQVRRSNQPNDVVYLAVEVSAVIDDNDVERAQQRAALLRKAGYRTVATVAGEEITESALSAATARSVLVAQDGLKQNWEQALALA